MNVKVTASDGVNLREGPYTSYDKLISSAIPKGEVLQVTGISQNNWGQVTYNGVTGWIAMSQVSEVKANTSVPADEVEEETEEEETIEPTETENATAELLDNGEPQSSFPMVALFIGLIIIVVIVAAVLIVVIVTKKK